MSRAMEGHPRMTTAPTTLRTMTMYGVPILLGKVYRMMMPPSRSGIA